MHINNSFIIIESYLKLQLVVLCCVVDLNFLLPLIVVFVCQQNLSLQSIEMSFTILSVTVAFVFRNLKIICHICDQKSFQNPPNTEIIFWCIFSAFEFFMFGSPTYQALYIYLCVTKWLHVSVPRRPYSGHKDLKRLKNYEAITSKSLTNRDVSYHFLVCILKNYFC